MLHAYKRELRTNLAKQLVTIRQSELDYYTTNISTIGTQSALLAGFAFSILASHSSSSVLTSLYAYTASKRRSSSFVILDAEWLRQDLLDGRQIILLLMEMVYLVSTALGARGAARRRRPSEGHGGARAGDGAAASCARAVCCATPPSLASAARRALTDAPVRAARAATQPWARRCTRCMSR